MIVVGNEGAGVPQEILSLADELVTIPHSPRVESLNAGIAASILLYEAARQKKQKRSPRMNTDQVNFHSGSSCPP